MALFNPISRVEWLPADLLVPNDWNPNHVLSPELKLIKLSMMEQGWIQPILVNREGDGYEIIDGFHRSTLCKTDKDVAQLSVLDGHPPGYVPAAILDLGVADRMMLTVRINRAKGTHQASLMHELVKTLIVEHEVPPAELAKKIGGTEHEIQTLLMEDVFQKLDIKSHTYSQAWRPRMKGE
jgi:ParB-like chromosome segregation protein Spo0J